MTRNILTIGASRSPFYLCVSEKQSKGDWKLILDIRSQMIPQESRQSTMNENLKTRHSRGQLYIDTCRNYDNHRRVPLKVIR